MRAPLPLRRAALSLLVLGSVSVAALAAESLSEETRLDVRTKAGPVETVIVSGLEAGEVRSITTASGHPALVTRTDVGLRLELGDESFEAALPDPDHIDAAALPADAKVVKIEKSHTIEMQDGQAGEKKTLVIRRHGADGDTELSGAEAEKEEAHVLASLAAPAPLADGQRIRVIRQVHRIDSQEHSAN
jgi:hypothetical protein